MPELDSRALHPRTVDDERTMQAEAGCTVGVDYPIPIVDGAEARQAAALVHAVRVQPDVKAVSAAVYTPPQSSESRARASHRPAGSGSPSRRESGRFNRRSSDAGGFRPDVVGAVNSPPPRRVDHTTRFR